LNRIANKYFLDDPNRSISRFGPPVHFSIDKISNANAQNPALMTVLTDAQKEIYAAAQQQPNAADAGAVQPAGGVGGRP
jgi:hypothetical protein